MILICSTPPRPTTINETAARSLMLIAQSEINNDECKITISQLIPEKETFYHYYYYIAHLQ